jgi:hypothetical protein
MGVPFQFVPIHSTLFNSSINLNRSITIFWNFLLSDKISIDTKIESKFKYNFNEMWLAFHLIVNMVWKCEYCLWLIEIDELPKHITKFMY